MPSSFSSEIKKLKESKLCNSGNKELVGRFIDYMQKSENSEIYKRNNLMTVRLFAEYLGEKQPTLVLDSISSKEEIISFLDTRKKDEKIDPDKRWIRTWNDYLHRIKHFMRWLHNSNDNSNNNNTLSSLSPSDWQTPPFAQIRKKKSKRISPYTESQVWEIEDLKLVIKYESNKRNKAALALLWDFNARPHEVTLLKIKHIRLHERYGEAEIPHDSKTGSGPAMLTLSLTYVRDWLNEHPFHNELEARLLCNKRGGPITPDALWRVTGQLRKRIVDIIESDSFTNESEREKLRVLVTTKKWNPYCFRHSSITRDAELYPEFALRKKVRWSPNSVQPARYIKNRWGNDLRQKILHENGITTEEDSKPIAVNAECARCKFINSLENKYCSACAYPLSVTAYEELKAEETKELDVLKAQMSALEAQVKERDLIFNSFMKGLLEKVNPTISEAYGNAEKSVGKLLRDLKVKRYSVKQLEREQQQKGTSKSRSRSSSRK